MQSNKTGHSRFVFATCTSQYIDILFIRIYIYMCYVYAYTVQKHRTKKTKKTNEHEEIICSADPKKRGNTPAQKPPVLTSSDDSQNAEHRVKEQQQKMNIKKNENKQ